MATKKKKDTAPEEEGAAVETEEAAPEAQEQTAAPEPDPLKEANDRYLRLLAEYDNYRKRSAKERENIYADVRVDTVTKFLPVYDNLARALTVSTADESFRKGVEMTFTQLVDVMQKLGIQPIEAVGQTFDPTRHNAVMHVEDDSVGENVVVEEFQKGFILGEKVIRFSMVKVAN